MNYKVFFDTATKILSNSIVKSVLVIIVAIAVYKVISLILNARGKRLKKLDRKKGETYIHLIKSTLKYTVIVIAFFVLLSVNKINITSMIAGLGIAGIILGVAVQDALKDIIRGFDIISDNYFKVGDIISVNGTEGAVLEIGIKTTKIKELKTDNTLSVPNREIAAAAQVSKFVFIDIPLPYELTNKNAREIMLEICKEAESAPEVKSCNYLGVNNLDDSAIKHLIKIECKSNAKRLQIRRDALAAALLVLEKRNVSVPYTQIDIHKK